MGKQQSEILEQRFKSITTRIDELKQEQALNEEKRNMFVEERGLEMKKLNDLGFTSVDEAKASKTKMEQDLINFIMEVETELEKLENETE